VPKFGRLNPRLTEKRENFQADAEFGASHRPGISWDVAT